MRSSRYLSVLLVFLGMSLPLSAVGQTDGDVSLGDLARSLRQAKSIPKEPVAANIIDNDNLAKVIDEVESLRMSKKPVFSFTSGAKQFQMSSPDGTCSLSFNAETTALVSSPFVSQSLPASELTKLDGPANLQDDTLEVAVYNASSWELREITIGFTIVHKKDADNAVLNSAKLLPAVVEEPDPGERFPDSTLLVHMKGSGAPLATTVFREKLEAKLNPDQEWHWAIVEAKGIPPAPALPPDGSKD